MSKYSASVASLPVPTVAVDAPLFKTLWHYCHQIAIFPWQLFLAWLSWCSTLLLTAVTYIGATPSGFIPNGKLRELNSIVDHMHKREDVYRKAIKEMQDELDAKDTDRKKALRHLKAKRTQLDALSSQLTALQQEYGATNGDEYSAHAAPLGAAHTLAETGGGSAMHVSMAAAAAAVWWFCQGGEHPALLWKILFAMFSPLCWFYVSWLTEAGGRGRRERPLVLICTCWFLVGFVASQRLASPDYDYSHANLPLVTT